MTDQQAFGLTPKMKATLEAITAFVARHGSMPSRRMLAQMIGCNATRASVLVTSIAERGGVTDHPESGALMGFGAGGIAIFVPNHVAAQLCAFCAERGESVVSVVCDAISLHLDALSEHVPAPQGIEPVEMERDA